MGRIGSKSLGTYDKWIAEFLQMELKIKSFNKKFPHLRIPTRKVHEARIRLLKIYSNKAEYLGRSA